MKNSKMTQKSHKLCNIYSHIGSEDRLFSFQAVLDEIIFLILEWVQFNPKERNLKTFNSIFFFFLVGEIKSLLNKLFCFRKTLLLHFFMLLACFWHPFLSVILYTCFHLTHFLRDTPTFPFFLRQHFSASAFVGLQANTRNYFRPENYSIQICSTHSLCSVCKMKFRENLGLLFFLCSLKIPHHTCVKNYLGIIGNLICQINA